MEVCMERRRLGKADMDADVLGFGGSEIGYQHVSRWTVARLLGTALDAGLNVIDTADCYENCSPKSCRGPGGVISSSYGPRRVRLDRLEAVNTVLIDRDIPDVA
jgi:Aldo/keto reductase family